MALKSVIDIDLNSPEFESFSEQWTMYQEQLEKTPDAWKKVAKAQSVAGDSLLKMVTALKEQNTQVSALATSERLWASIGSMSSLVLRNVIGIGGTLLKFGLGVAAGVVGGGLYGIDKMAEKIAADRRQAMGLGMSIGGLQSWQTNMSRVVDPDSYLANVAGMETDISQQKAWWSLMGGQMSGNTGMDATAMLRAEREKLQSVPENQMGMIARAYGFNDDPAFMLRMRNMAPAEFNQLLTSTAKDQKGGMSVADKTAKAWTDLTTQISRAGTTIEDIFVKKLVPLAAPLGKLSQAVTKDIQAFTQTDAFTSAIQAAAAGVNDFSAKIDDPSFMKGLDSFTKDIKGIAAFWDKLFSSAATGKGFSGWAGRTIADITSMLHGNLMSDVLGTPANPASALADAISGSNRSAADLRSLDLLQGLSLAPIAIAAPQSYGPVLQAGQMPSHITITNMTGGSAVVAINGLVGAH